MTPVSSRLKDALWSIRQRHGMEGDIDRVIPFLVFEQDLSKTQLEDLFVGSPRRVPEEFRAALVARIQETIRYYWTYRKTHRGYHKVLKGILFLEGVARVGPDGCKFIHDANTGYRLELKKGK